MKKNFKKLLFAMLLTAGTLTFVSCGDDDDDDATVSTKDCTCKVTLTDDAATTTGNEFTRDVTDFEGDCADVTAADLGLGGMSSVIKSIECSEK